MVALGSQSISGSAALVGTVPSLLWGLLTTALALVYPSASGSTERPAGRTVSDSARTGLVASEPPRLKAGTPESDGVARALLSPPRVTSPGFGCLAHRHVLGIWHVPHVAVTSRSSAVYAHTLAGANHLTSYKQGLAVRCCPPPGWLPPSPRTRLAPAARDPFLGLLSALQPPRIP